MKIKFNKKEKEEKDWTCRRGKPSKYKQTNLDNNRRLPNGSIVKSYALRNKKHDNN